MLDSSSNAYMSPTPVSLPRVTSLSLSFDDIIEVSESDNSTTEVTPTISSPEIQTSPPPLRRSTRQTNITQVADHVVNPTFHCFLSTLATIKDPTTFSQAI